MKQPKRVLVVEDEEDVRETLQNILFDFACDLSEAEDGGKALELMSTNEFDVIFLDLKLPDRSGIETFREARKLSTTLGKVIILTGFPEPGTKTEARNLGAFRYLSKPLNWEEIRRAFAEAISPSTVPSLSPKPEREVGRTVSGAPQRRARAAGGRGAGSVSRARLLVLDDSPSWLDTMEEVLGNDFDLTLTASAEEACKRARRGHFDLVVLDMQLDMQLVGGVTGLDVLSRMRRASPELRAIILTGYPDYRSAIESGKRGAIDYVSKRELATLTDTVRRILSDARPLRVFLSYDRGDRAQVTRLYRRLLSRGFLPLMDVMSIPGGKKWEPEIRRLIAECDYFVCCLSRNSLYKEGDMRKEVNQALERQAGLRDDSVFFIPARLEDCEDVEPFRQFVYVDLFRSDGFPNLLRSLTPDEKADQ